MTQRKFESAYTETRHYIFNTSKLSIDDFLRLEQVASTENEIMKYRIFFVYKLNEYNKVFTGLN